MRSEAEFLLNNALDPARSMGAAMYQTSDQDAEAPQCDAFT